MNSIHYLVAAYVITWALHSGYIFYLSSRARRLREEVKELDSARRNS